MKIEAIEELVNAEREIEFTYDGHKYSITYYNDKRENYISFCQFYRKPTDVKNVKELLQITVSGRTLESILSSLPDRAFDIY